MTPRVLAFVFARGGSKGIPRKNLQELAGKPLIAHSIHCALQISAVERVILSTEDSEIAEVGRRYGAEIPFQRPVDLATDKIAEHPVWKHAITEMTNLTGPFDLLLSLPATSPLRAPTDVQKCLDQMTQLPEADAVITVRKAGRNPYYNMVQRDPVGFVHIVGKSHFSSRQDAPEVFDITTVAYVARTDFVLRSNHLFEGRIKAVEIPAVRAVDIDEPLDLEWARFLVATKHPDLL